MCPCTPCVFKCKICVVFVVKCALGCDLGLESRAKWTMKKLYDYIHSHTHTLSLPLQAALWAVKVRRENIGGCK